MKGLLIALAVLLSSVNYVCLAGLPTGIPQGPDVPVTFIPEGWDDDGDYTPGDGGVTR